MFLLPLVDLLHDDIEASITFDGSPVTSASVAPQYGCGRHCSFATQDRVGICRVGARLGKPICIMRAGKPIA